MPSPRAILIDLAQKNIDPSTIASCSIGKDGHLRSHVKVSKAAKITKVKETHEVPVAIEPSPELIDAVTEPEKSGAFVEEVVTSIEVPHPTVTATQTNADDVTVTKKRNKHRGE